MQVNKNIQAILLCGLLVAVLLAGCSRSSAKASTASQDAATRSVPVAASPVTTQDVPVYLQGLGNVTGYNTVAVKARVDGQLVSVNFKEGQEVKKGDLLAQIDPRPLQAVLDQAKANLAKDEAALTDA